MVTSHNPFKESRTHHTIAATLSWPKWCHFIILKGELVYQVLPSPGNNWYLGFHTRNPRIAWQTPYLCFCLSVWLLFSGVHNLEGIVGNLVRSNRETYLIPNLHFTWVDSLPKENKSYVQKNKAVVGPIQLFLQKGYARVLFKGAHCAVTYHKGFSFPFENSELFQNDNVTEQQGGA